MKKALAIVLSLVLIIGSAAVSFVSATADTLDAYTGDSWNHLQRSFFNNYYYDSEAKWANDTATVSWSNGSGRRYMHYSVQDTSLNYIGSYIKWSPVSMPAGTFDLSYTIANNFASNHLEVYTADGTLIGQTSVATSSSTTSTGTITFPEAASDYVFKLVCDSNPTATGTFRHGSSKISITGTSDTPHTQKYLDASRAYAGTSGGGSKSTTNGATPSYDGHESCELSVADGKHTAVGATGLNVGDYVYYKFTDIPAGTYNITDTYYDVTSGKASWDVYVGNSVENLTQTASMTAAGGNVVKTIKSENITVDTTGVLIYACKFTAGTDGSCRTVHFCFDLEQTSATGEPLETTSTVEVEESSSTTTTTTTQIPEESSSQAPEGSTTYTNQSAWVDGQKYLLIMPSCLIEGYMGKGILITNGLVSSSYTGTDTVASLKLTDYDCSSVNTKKECNALLSFTTTQDLSQYYFTAVKQGDYFAFKTSDGKYLCAGKQEGKNSWDWNRTYFSDTIVDDALFTGNYITGATGSGDSNLGNNAFKVTSKTGYHLRTLNNGDVICKADADYYQGFVGFYTTGEAVEETPTVDIEMKTGAALRLNAVNGIRFYTQVDSDKIADLIADGYTVEMGTLIAPADLLTSTELTFESGVSCLDVKYQAKDESGNFIYYEGGNTIVGSIVEIKETSNSWSATSGNITRDFVGRGYVKVTKDGETTISYADYANGNIANNSRSLQYIANAYKNDVNSDYSLLGEVFKALVDKWVAAVK